MPSSSVLDIEALLAPIPGDNPAGQATPYMLKQQIDDARKEVNPDDFDADDPVRPSEPKFADWNAIERITTQALKETGKDLLLAARLTEAATKKYGFAGLADCLELLKRLITECWDRIHPSIEDGDLEVRAAPFNWLGEADRGARFPYAIRLAPLVKGEERSFSWQDWKQSQSGAGQSTTAAFERAIASTPREVAQNLVDDLERAVQDYMQLDQALAEKLGREAPAMTDLVSAINDCRSLAKQILAKKGAAPEDAPQEEHQEEQQADGTVVTTMRVKAAVTREDIYSNLGQLAEQLAKLEPHSPVPFLIRKAVEFGSMSFPAMMKALLRDNTSVMTEMYRELGIKEEENS